MTYAMKILTTLFLAFAMCSFLHFAYKKRKDIHNLVGDIISAVFMAWAIYFMWGGKNGRKTKKTI